MIVSDIKHIGFMTKCKEDLILSADYPENSLSSWGFAFWIQWGKVGDCFCRCKWIFI